MIARASSSHERRDEGQLKVCSELDSLQPRRDASKNGISHAATAKTRGRSRAGVKAGALETGGPDPRVPGGEDDGWMVREEPLLVSRWERILYTSWTTFPGNKEDNVKRKEED